MSIILNWLGMFNSWSMGTPDFSTTLFVMLCSQFWCWNHHERLVSLTASDVWSLLWGLGYTSVVSRYGKTGGRIDNQGYRGTNVFSGDCVLMDKIWQVKKNLVATINTYIDVEDTQTVISNIYFTPILHGYIYRITRLRLFGNAESPPVELSPRSPDLVPRSKVSADLSRSCLRDPRRLSDSLSRLERSRSWASRRWSDSRGGLSFSRWSISRLSLRLPFRLSFSRSLSLSPRSLRVLLGERRDETRPWCPSRGRSWRDSRGSSRLLLDVASRSSLRRIDSSSLWLTGFCSFEAKSFCSRDVTSVFSR